MTDPAKFRLGFLADGSAPFAFDPITDGNLAVFGGPNSGRSTMLSAIATSLASDGMTELIAVSGHRVLFGRDAIRIDERTRREELVVDNSHNVLEAVSAVRREVQRREGMLDRFGMLSVSDLPVDLRPSPLVLLVDSLPLFASGLVPNLVYAANLIAEIADLGRNLDVRVVLDVFDGVAKKRENIDRLVQSCSLLVISQPGETRRALAVFGDRPVTEFELSAGPRSAEFLTPHGNPVRVVLDEITLVWKGNKFAAAA